MPPVADVVGGAVGDAIPGDGEPSDEELGDVGTGDVGDAAVHAPSATASAMSVRHLDVVGGLILAIVTGCRAAEAGRLQAGGRAGDAPVADFADMVVVGDLFAIFPPLIEAIKARKSARG